ncbi:transcription factor Adf-1 [Stomoxys calcitrans]|uniref:MADF domain-containing protein n=1 Tax=Stomoxys calcitrans TaxID=35570 RepID=A0A1I8PU21_STOCA|nr:transcription factor Adf-1 [Stomoxys calcitrans]
MEFELIDFVKANPILYDRKYRSLHYRERKMEKWNEIARKLRRDPTTLRLKWKNLRDTYKKRLLRRKGDDEDVLTSRNWKYHNLLTFLKDQYTKQLEEYRIENEADSEDEDLQMKQEENPTNTEDVEFEVETFDLNDYLKKFDASTASNSADNVPAPTTTEELPKKKKFDKETVINDACQEMTNLLQSAKQHFTPPSATQAFFNAIAIQVTDAKLQAVDLMRLQQRVLEVITQEILTYQQNRIYDS